MRTCCSVRIHLTFSPLLPFSVYPCLCAPRVPSENVYDDYYCYYYEVGICIVVVYVPIIGTYVDRILYRRR